MMSDHYVFDNKVIFFNFFLIFFFLIFLRVIIRVNCYNGDINLSLLMGKTNICNHV